MAPWANPTENMTDDEKIAYYLTYRTPETQALIKEWQTHEDSGRTVELKLTRDGFGFIVETNHDGAYAHLYPLDAQYMEVIAYSDAEPDEHRAVGYYNTHTRQVTLTVHVYTGDESGHVKQVTFRADNIDDIWMKLDD